MSDKEPWAGHFVSSSHQNTQSSSSQSQNGSIIPRPMKRELSIGNDITPNKRVSSSLEPSSTHPEYNNDICQNVEESVAETTPINQNDVFDQQRPLSFVRSSPNIDPGNCNILIHQQKVNSHEGQQVINIYNTTIQNYISVPPSQPRQPDFPGVRSALESYYKRYLKIQLVSGKPIGFERCYVNLAIVEAIHQYNLDRDILDNHVQYYNRMNSYEKIRWTKLESTIQIEELFNMRKLRNGSQGIPKKILIQGRAGIGKTTLCKKIVHQFINGEWRNRFEAVLWIPLRQLKVFKPQNIEDLVKSKYVPQLSNKNKSLLASDISTGIDLGGILFILDGLDEVIQDIQTDIVLKSFLNHLLQQTHVIITSRPSGVDYSILPVLDLELETVGFNTDNIKEYVNNVMDAEEAVLAMNFIEQTSILQSLANIPVQLDVICHTWKSLPKDIDAVTVTKLYQVMVDKLLCNDVTRIGKANNGKAVSIQLMSGSNEHRAKNMMNDEIEYLSYLAFDGIKNNRIEFDYDILDEIVDQLNHFREHTNQDQLPLDLLEILNQTSFLHSVKDTIDPQDDPTQQTYHFIHLTFQEYFAAIWLSTHFQLNAGISSDATHAPMSVNREDVIRFIEMNKYNPRCEIIWWMIAGLLDGEALESYFQLLQAPPRDLIGVRHQLLITGCYKESHNRLPVKLVNKLQSEITQWFRLESKMTEKHIFFSANGLKSAIPDDLFFKIAKEHSISRTQGFTNSRKNLRPSTIEQVIPLLLHKDRSVKNLARDTLQVQSTMSESTISALITNLQDQDSNVRSDSVVLLTRQSKLSERAITAFINALQDQDYNVRWVTLDALGRQSTLSESAISAIANTLQDQNLQVKYSAVEALGRHSTDSTLTAILFALQDKDAAIRVAAINALGKRSIISESILTALVTALQDYDSDVRQAAIGELGKQPMHSESILAAMISSLQDQDSWVRYATVYALNKQFKCSESVLNAIIITLNDQDSRVRYAAIEVLGKQLATLGSKVAQLLPNNLSNRLLFVGRLEESALDNRLISSESSVMMIIAALDDQDSDIRKVLIDKLSKISKIPDPIISALVGTLRDPIKEVQKAAIEVLSKQSEMSDSTLEALINTIQNRDSPIYDEVVRILCSQSKMSETMIAALTTAQEYSNNGTKREILNAFGKQSRISENILATIMNSLQNQDQFVRTAALDALGKQPSITTPALAEIVAALQDPDLNVRHAAINALGRQSSFSKLPIATLNATLRDKGQLSFGTFVLFNRETIFNLILSQIVPSVLSDGSGTRGFTSSFPETTRTLDMSESTKHNIEMLCSNFLFDYSTGYHLTLCINGNKLQMYTEQGLDESVEMRKEDLCALEAGFVAAQRAGGIEIDYSFTK